MLEFFSNLQWYEWVLGIIATLVIAVPAFYFMLGMLLMLVFTACTNQRVGNLVFSVIFGGAAIYITYLLTKYL